MGKPYESEPTEQERLRGLARWADELVRPDFAMGAWEASRETEPGVWTMPYYELGEEGTRFIRDIGRLGWVYPFDWMQWLQTPDGRRLSGSPDAVATASVADLAKLLTSIIRSERFGDGNIEGAFESGMLLAIVRRAGVLAAEPGAPGSAEGSAG